MLKEHFVRCVPGLQMGKQRLGEGFTSCSLQRANNLGRPIFESRACLKSEAYKFLSTYEVLGPARWRNREKRCFNPSGAPVLNGGAQNVKSVAQAKLNGMRQAPGSFGGGAVWCWRGPTAGRAGGVWRGGQLCGQFQTEGPGVEPALAVEAGLSEVDEETQVLRTGSQCPQSHVHYGWGGAGPCP